jgi:uncharacterized glyoxalase superfamily metalloenzyme YdcJ
MTTADSASPWVDKIVLQHRLFARLSTMFAEEVPLYDKSLGINQICNRAICDLLSRMFPAFSIDEDQIVSTSGERHGAIRIGRPDEYRWVGRLFACFGMEPHQFYDMANVGAKSQPIIATAFRSRVNPEHRVFCSLLLTDYFDSRTRERLEALLSQRQVISAAARNLIDLSHRQGGLNASQADALIEHCTTEIFKWQGQALDYDLYEALCRAGFKIAADIACFHSHHLNHLTPNTFGIDVYTAAMKFCLGEVDANELRERLTWAAEQLEHRTDHHLLRLLFRHLSDEQVEHCQEKQQLTTQQRVDWVERLIHPLQQPQWRLSDLNQAGFKDSTEGPCQDTPVLLRQDAYKALSEPVTFTQPDGSQVLAAHTARFGEIEQRFYATTPAGRQLYDACLAEADRQLVAAGLTPQLWREREAIVAAAFRPFPKTLPELYQQGLVFVRFRPTSLGLQRAGSLSSMSLEDLIAQGFVTYAGLRYEDFLPVSAAGIFASNLNQYGTQATATQRPVYGQSDLESILERSIVDAMAQDANTQQQSLGQTWLALGLPATAPPAPHPG